MPNYGDTVRPHVPREKATYIKKNDGNAATIIYYFLGLTTYLKIMLMAESFEIKMFFIRMNRKSVKIMTTLINFSEAVCGEWASKFRKTLLKEDTFCITNSVKTLISVNFG